MNPSDSNRPRRIAERQLWAGWATAAAMLVARASTVVLQLNRGRLDPVLFGQAVFKTGLLIVVVLLYRHRVWPAYLMLAVWPVGFVFAWVVVHASPSVLAVGVLVGVGFGLGARGAYMLHWLRA